MADLTRFDFHVVRFMNSYDVEIMTAEEVGQFLLLLCKSWLLQKDTALPNDPAYLARIARSEKVSEHVLAKFPLVETPWGTMRRNETLYQEWLAAAARSDSGRERVAARGGKWAETAQDKYCSNTVVSEPVLRKSIPIPYHTNPNQTVSTQTSASDWDLFRKRHSHLLGKKANSTKFRDKYESACNKYGEDVVFTCFNEWAETAKEWVKRENVKEPLYAFFKTLDSLADDELVNRQDKQEIQQEESSQLKEKQEVKRQIDANIERQKKADWEFMAKTPPIEGASALEYLEDIK